MPTTTTATLLASNMLAATGSSLPGKTLLEHIAAGGIIGHIIVLLSFVAVALAIAHLVQIRESRLAPIDTVERLDELLRTGNIRGAIQYCQASENACFLTRVMGAALTRCARSPFGFLELKSALEESGQLEVSRLYRATDGIGLIASVAPMLGLLGTVVGMVGAFDTISSAEGFARPEQLAGNISMALITTVEGLVVAIPATAAFTYFRNRVDAVSVQVAEIVEDLASHLELASGASAAAPARPGPPAPAAMARPAAAPGAAGGGVKAP